MGWSRRALRNTGGSMAKARAKAIGRRYEDGSLVARLTWRCQPSWKRISTSSETGVKQELLGSSGRQTRPPRAILWWTITRQGRCASYDGASDAMGA